MKLDLHTYSFLKTIPNPKLIPRQTTSNVLKTSSHKLNKKPDQTNKISIIINPILYRI